MCRRLAVFFLWLLLGFSGTGIRAARAESRFFHAISDVPLMPGLQEETDQDVTFDPPAGRIIEASAQGSVSAEAARIFYRQTLPQLGWQANGTDQFQREGEHLSFRFAPRGGRLFVYVTVEPRS